MSLGWDEVFFMIVANVWHQPIELFKAISLREIVAGRHDVVELLALLTGEFEGWPDGWKPEGQRVSCSSTLARCEQMA